jgi:hypothetical protein
MNTNVSLTEIKGQQIFPVKGLTMYFWLYGPQSAATTGTCHGCSKGLVVNMEVKQLDCVPMDRTFFVDTEI